MAAFSAIPVLAGEDVIERLGNLTAWSGGLWLSSVLFAAASVAAAYLAWWGYIGIRMWV